MLIQMFALVIYLNNKYWEHEVDAQVPEAVFCPGGEALHNLVEHLLQQKDFWAAERLLEICFRRPNDNATILSREASRDRFAQRDCKRIWRSVEWFVNTMDGDRGSPLDYIKHSSNRLRRASAPESFSHSD